MTPQLREVELEADQEHEQDHTDLREDTERLDHQAGNRYSSASGHTATSRLGPSRMPATISPRTRGCPILEIAHPPEPGGTCHDRQREQEPDADLCWSHLPNLGLG
jgi:hypothetical protein